MNVLKAKNLEDLVKRLNPFGVKIDNKLVTFDDYGEAYLYVMKYLHNKFPMGFIDVPMLITEMMGVPFKTGKLFTDRIIKYSRMENDVILCAWKDPNTNVRYIMELLMRDLHALSETSFSNEEFQKAWEEFEECIINNS